MLQMQKCVAFLNVQLFIDFCVEMAPTGAFVIMWSWALVNPCCSSNILFLFYRKQQLL